eukprot:354123_1
MSDPNPNNQVKILGGNFYGATAMGSNTQRNNFNFQNQSLTKSNPEEKKEAPHHNPIKTENNSDEIQLMQQIRAMGFDVSDDILGILIEECKDINALLNALTTVRINQSCHHDNNNLSEMANHNYNYNPLLTDTSATTSDPILDSTESNTNTISNNDDNNNNENVSVSIPAPVHRTSVANVGDNDNNTVVN